MEEGPEATEKLGTKEYGQGGKGEHPVNQPMVCLAAAYKKLKSCAAEMTVAP